MRRRLGRDHSARTPPDAASLAAYADRGSRRALTVQTSVSRIDSEVGPSEVHLQRPVRARGLLVLGHGAGGGVDAPDLRAAVAVALAEGWAAARVVQPYRLAGRRTPPPAAQLDAAWASSVAAIRRRRGFGALPLVLGGRSSGARVACRTARALGASGVLALAFPLRPPGRSRADRSAELRDAGVPVLVIQGERDGFGDSAAVAEIGVPSVTVCGVPGADHSLRASSALDAVRAVLRPWLAGFSH